MASAGLILLAIAVGSVALSSPDSPDVGKRVESDSFTSPQKLARCISYNINKKMPNLHVRNSAGDSPDEGAFLVLTNNDLPRETFGVIRVVPVETGSHLTTWLRGSRLAAAPEDMARRLVAGC